MEMKLEVVPISVTDTDRAIEFYRDKIGFVLDEDIVDAAADFRFVQLSPPGSACSIMLGDNVVDMPPGSINGVMLVVDHLDSARKQLVANGVDVSPIQHFTETGLAEGKGEDWNAYIFFKDPDDNGWTIQERPAAA